MIRLQGTRASVVSRGWVQRSISDLDAGFSAIQRFKSVYAVLPGFRGEKGLRIYGLGSARLRLWKACMRTK